MSMSAEMPKPVATSLSSGITNDLIRVRVRPNSSVDVGQKLYTADQMREFAQEATRQAMERVATWVENYPHDKLGPAQTQRLAQDIRSLLSDLDARGKK